MSNIFDIPKLFTALAEWMACVALVIVYRPVLSPRERHMAVLKLAASLVLLYGIQEFCGRVDGALWLFGMAVAILVMTASVRFCLPVTWWGASYFCARLFMLAEFLAALEWQLFYYYNFRLGQVQEWRIFFIGLSICLAFYITGYALFVFWERRGLSAETASLLLAARPRDAVTVWTVAIIMFAVSNLSYTKLASPFTGTAATEIFNIRTLVDMAGVITLQALHVVKREADQRLENEAIRNTLWMQHMQFEESQKNIELINRKYHDLKHQLQILRTESDDTRRMAYLDEIQSGIEQYEAENKTGNPVLDAILTAKSGECLRKNITMTVVADGTLLEHLKTMDICTIFGNALDNAIEYVSRLEEIDNRLIHVSVSEKNSFVCILVENFYVGEPIPEGSLPSTTKADKQHHGFGLKSVKYTVERYGGYLHTGVRDGWFRLEMIMP